MLTRMEPMPKPSKRSPETFNPILEEINAPWPNPKRRQSWLFNDHYLGWRDAVIVLVWAVLFVGFLPVTFHWWAWGNDYLTAHLLVTFVLALWLSAGGAGLIWMMMHG
jgi:hypothetical protein